MRSAPLVAVALLLLSTTSCAGMMDRARKDLAAKQLECPADQITAIPVTEPNVPRKFQGCGKEDSVISHCVTAHGSGGSAQSCTLLWFSAAINQASFTTGCAKEEVTTQWMAPNLAVDACGKRMMFAPSFSGWVVSSSSGTP